MSYRYYVFNLDDLWYWREEEKTRGGYSSRVIAQREARKAFLRNNPLLAKRYESRRQRQ